MSIGFQMFCAVSEVKRLKQIATISNSYMFIDGSNIKHFTVHIDDIWVNDTTNVEEIENENGFVVYPNPSHDVLFVLSESINSEYRITNIMGQTIMTGNITSENQMIDVSSLSNGIYFITFAGETQKFVVK